ncbi:MAG TPA: glycosyltransferase, partial [Lacunisphaera sp.]|nr:glycosyltransferase [Lacunisphaera sp.]
MTTTGHPPPRILFLSNESPHSAAAGAIVLQRLFQSYPADRMLVVTNNPPPASAARLSCRYAELSLAVDRLNRTRFSHWRPALRVLGGASLISLARVDSALEGFVPDLVATVMQDSWYYDLAARYANHRKIPLVLFIHDYPQGFEPVWPWLRDRQAARDVAVYRQAARRLCVSPGMAAHFQHEFGLSGDVLLPPRSDTTPRQSPEQCAQLRQPGRLTLGYAGGLHYGYGKQLLQMLPVLRATGTMVELFGPAPSGMLASLRDATDVLRFNGYVSPPEAAWGELLKRCDVVLQPYLNPAGKHELQYRTHFPSKLGDCLSLGLPLLITGPADASGVKWCLQHPGCAHVVTEPGAAALDAALRRLAADSSHRVALARQAQAVAGG